MDASDRDLIEAFASAGSQAAFAALVERHWPMVARTCRRVLGDAVDADDAAQAAFLALSQAARGGKEITNVPGWLHRVATNAALNQREAARARQRHERAAGQDASMPSAPDEVDSARSAIDAALERVPERYRLPLVLHYLEGRPLERIARELNTNVGTVGSWLSRGRRLLERQLARGGAAAVALAAIAEQHTDIAPAGDARRALLRAVAGEAQPSPRVLELARAARPRRMPWVPALVSAIAVAVALVGLAFAQSSRPTSADVSPAEPRWYFAERYRVFSLDQPPAASTPALAVGALPGEVEETFVGSARLGLDEMFAIYAAGTAIHMSDATAAAVRDFAAGRVPLMPASASRDSFLLLAIPLDREQKPHVSEFARHGDEFTIRLWRGTSGSGRTGFAIIDLGRLRDGVYAATVVEESPGAPGTDRSARILFKVGGPEQAVAVLGEDAFQAHAVPPALPAPPAVHKRCLATDAVGDGLTAVGTWDGVWPEADAPGWTAQAPALRPLDSPGQASVLIAAAPSACADVLRVVGMRLHEGECTLVVEHWLDPAITVRPHRALLLVPLEAQPRPARLRLEWRELRRGADGGYRETATAAPGRDRLELR